jgi:predicted NAD/FAD-binding protein
MRTAIVGSGITGLATAHVLDRHREVVLFEADRRLGGHANTVIVEDPLGGPTAIDTGFIVHNDRNYPNLVRLFEELGVETKDSEMSFGVFDPDEDLSYRATNLKTLFASRSNLVSRPYWKMLADVPRFWRDARRILDSEDRTLTLTEFIDRQRYSDAFVRWHLIPMGAAIWSADPTRFGAFPAYSLFSFLRNHGLLGLGDRPQWKTVVGGSQRYVQALAGRLQGQVRLSSPVTGVCRVAEGVEVRSRHGVEIFDEVVLACHTDQALDIMDDASPAEKEVLGSIAYQPNTAILHTDVSVLPPSPRAQAAWNYLVVDGATAPTVTYDLSLLHRLGGQHRYLLSLNMDDQIDESGIIDRFQYAHPVFDRAALAAQDTLSEINGQGGVYFAGAWAGHGFHEDGLRAALDVCARIGVSW